MNNYSQAYIAIDSRSNHSQIGYMNEDGEYIDQQQVQTSVRNLRNYLVAIPADHKQLTIEQGNMSFYMAEQLRGDVDRLIVCDPHHNHLIAHGANKNDRLDTLKLCKLLRLGELKAVWTPKKMDTRRLFFQQIKEYQRLRKMLVAQKNQLQAELRHWGINIAVRAGDYRDSRSLLDRIHQPAIVDQVAAKVQFIQLIAKQKAEQFQRAETTASEYGEIREFQKIPGIGPVGAHTFSAYIQTPHRFRRRSQLIRFCQLGVRKRSSDGRRLKSERLDQAGHGCLKHLSHVAWKTARKSDNEVRRFYRDSLERTGKAVNARLNTQRKILITLWILWKHNRTYQPARFYAGRGDSTQ